MQSEGLPWGGPPHGIRNDLRLCGSGLKWKKCTCKAVSYTHLLTASAGGIAAAVVFAVVMALLFRPGDKR